MSEKMIVVNETYYLAIQQDSEFLECLDACKVHEWDGYQEAVEMHEESMDQTEGEEYGYEG